eukprot:367757-Amphidinium_carterae.2
MLFCQERPQLFKERVQSSGLQSLAKRWLCLGPIPSMLGAVDKTNFHELVGTTLNEKELFPSPWDDQGALYLYWIEHPDRLTIDVDAKVFASTKRFFRLNDDDGSGRRRSLPNCTRTIPHLFVHGWGQGERWALPIIKTEVDKQAQMGCFLLVWVWLE